MKTLQTLVYFSLQSVSASPEEGWVARAGASMRNLGEELRRNLGSSHTREMLFYLLIGTKIFV